MIGKFVTDPEGKLNYEISKYCDSWNSILRNRISKEFGLHSLGDVFCSQDFSEQEFEIDNIKISMDWDAWDGFVIKAGCPKANKLVKEIANYIEKLNFNFGKRPNLLRRLLESVCCSKFVGAGPCPYKY